MKYLVLLYMTLSGRSIRNRRFTVGSVLRQWVLEAASWCQHVPTRLVVFARQTGWSHRWHGKWRAKRLAWKNSPPVWAEKVLKHFEDLWSMPPPETPPCVRTQPVVLAWTGDFTFEGLPAYQKPHPNNSSCWHLSVLLALSLQKPAGAAMPAQAAGGENLTIFDTLCWQYPHRHVYTYWLSLNEHDTEKCLKAPF